MIEAGGNRSTESFDYGTGDIWLYGANEAHMVQGHKDGCTYLAGALHAATLSLPYCLSYRARLCVLYMALGGKLCAAPHIAVGH